MACVVPTFEAGVRAQTGADLSGVGLQPAWGAAGDVKLPVYYSWRFRTGVPGDFEDAARLLHPVVADTIPGLGRSKLSMPAEAIPGVTTAQELPAVRTLLTTATEADLMEAEVGGRGRAGPTGRDRQPRRRAGRATDRAASGLRPLAGPDRPPRSRDGGLDR